MTPPPETRSHSDSVAPVLPYASPDADTWEPTIGQHTLLGASSYLLTTAALVSGYPASDAFHTLIRSALLALLAITTGLFLFLPGRWALPSVLRGVALAAGILILTTIGYALTLPPF